MKINLTFLILTLQLICLDSKAQIYSQFEPRKSLNLDGQVNFIDAGNNDRNISNAFTLEAWIKTKVTHRQWIIGKQTATSGYQLVIDNGRAELSGNAAGINVTSGSSHIKVNDNRWHHVAGIFAGSRLEIWVDGILQSTSPIGSPVLSLPANAPLIIGRNPLNASEYFKGLLGEIKLWNTVRSANEIRTFMGKIIKVNPTELVGYFRCDPSLAIPRVSTVLHDFSNLHLHGQINANILNYVLPAPPIGDESVFYYGNDLAAKTFKMGGYTADTVYIKDIQGQAQGFHFYRNNLGFTLTGSPPAGQKLLSPFYYGAFAAGDTNATYQAKLTIDTADCIATFIFMKRKDNSTGFDKLRPGRYNPALDTAMQTSEVQSSEYAYIIAWPEHKTFFNGNITQCPESRPTTLTASKGIRYYWSTGASTKTISVTQPGKYFVTLFDRCSEIGSDTFRIVPGLPVILPKLKTEDTIICHNEPLILRMPKEFNYLWPDGSTADSFAITTAGNYQVNSIDPRCGNFVTSSIKVRTKTCNDDKVYIPNIITPNNDGLNDAFIPLGLMSGQWGLTIYNRWGKQVYHTFSYKNDWKAKGLGTGVYYYFFQSAKLAKSYKGYIEVVK